ncbi:MAG: FAD-dependent thymidylate synthase [Succinivibrionaceae bacterium]
MSIFKPETFPVYYNNGVDIVYQACTCCYNINNPSIDYFEKKKYIEKRIKAKHTSILEHAHFALCIEDAQASLSWNLAILSDAFKYLFVKCVENEKGTLNILISGSIRAYRHFAIQAAKENLLDTLIYKEIMRVLSYYSVDVFFNDLIENGTILDTYEFSKIQYEEFETPELIETDKVCVLSYITSEQFKEIEDKMFKYCFQYEDLIQAIPVTVLFKNMSRTATHQLVRHRNAITQESQRYVDYSHAKFTTPDIDYIQDGENKKFNIFFLGHTTNVTLEELGEQICNIYSQLRTQGLNKEDARAFLPSNVQCGKLYMTFTLSSLRDFLILRTDKHAQAEIRSYANDIKDLKLIPESEMF